MKRYKSKFKEQRGQGMGMGGQVQGDGGANTCCCPECGNIVPHERGIPCIEINCPECGASMVGQ